MKPWFPGFQGGGTQGGRHLDDGGCVDSGRVQILSSLSLPPGRWTQDYKEYLDTLVEKKLIGGFTNNSTTEDVDFEIMGYTGKDLLKDLKLKRHSTHQTCISSTPQRVSTSTQVPRKS
jgi:DNA topoisomerase II